MGKSEAESSVSQLLHCLSPSDLHAHSPVKGDSFCFPYVITDFFK